jgi:DNA-binding transcriptional MocR family regulator
MAAIGQYQLTACSAAELVREIEAGVAAGQLLPGQALPSVRQMATEVGLSPATVAAGLAELRRRGVVLTEPRRGTRIGQAPPVGSVMASVPVPAGARDLSRGNPDPALLPDLSDALQSLELPVRLYGQSAEVPELLEICRTQLQSDNIASDWLCIVSGALDGIERILTAHLRPGDRVAVENPGYAALFHLLRARSLGFEPIAIDDRGMLPAELEQALARGAKAVVITPRGQNPTGAALDSERALELRAVLSRFSTTLVIEDDHLADVAGTPFHSVVGDSQHWATTRSVAKTLGPDLRLAILAGDRQSIDRVQGLQACGPGWVSHILQRLVLAMFSDPAVKTLIDRASTTYARRRGTFMANLKDENIKASGSSGLNVWVPVEDETSVVGALLQRGWVLAPGMPYRLAGSPPAIRITIATLLEHEAKQLACDLANVLDAATHTRSG